MKWNEMKWNEMKSNQMKSNVAGMASDSKTPEAVPSIYYIGRHLDASYIGRQMYGEISIYLSDKNLAWDI